MDSSNARAIGARFGWSSLPKSANRLAFKIRSRIIDTIPPGLHPPLQRAYWRLSGKGRSVAFLRQHRLRMFDLGYAERGHRELLAVADGARDRWLQLQAYWDLLNWHSAGTLEEEDTWAVLRYADAIQQLEVRPERLIRLAIAKAFALRRFGELERAEEIIRDRSLMTDHPDLVLARASIEDNLDARKEAVNQVFVQQGLSEIGLLGGSAPAFDRLTANCPKLVPESEGPLISVIVPAYNSQATITTAIRSLKNQTWRNLEIIIVDACSTDDTAAIVVALAEEDSRVRLLRAKRNSGAYCARNLGLKAARGKYVTCHDADDWSHPRKLQIQAEDLERRSDRIVANFSALLFLDEDLRAASRHIGSYARKNTSSLMFRREPIVEKLGAWDAVRFAADTEFLERIYAVFSRSSVNSITKPLSLVRIGNCSLTASSSFGYHGFRMGARQYYCQRYQQYHRSGKPLRLSGKMTDRPFYVPEPMLPWRVPLGERRCFDVVLVFDCRLGGADLRRAQNTIGKYRGEGLTVAVFHLPLYEPDPEKPVDEAIVELLDRGSLDYLVLGERVECDKLHILKWPLLLDYNRFFIDVTARHIEVTTNDTTTAQGSAQAVEPSQEYRQRCEAHLRRYCDAPMTWRSLQQ